MDITENFLDWFKNQDSGWRDTIAFEILFLAPNYDISNNESLDTFVNFTNYIKNDLESTKKIGKLIYIINAIDFIVNDYDNIDTLIDGQNIIKRVIEEGELNGKNMNYMKNIHSQGNQKFEERKEFKQNWIEYRDANLSFEILDTVLKKCLLDKK